MFLAGLEITVVVAGRRGEPASYVVTLMSRLHSTLGVAALAAWSLVTPLGAVGGPPDWMLELTVRGQRIEGAPVAWNLRQVVLLARDGQLWQFAPEEATDYRKTADAFRGYSASQLRTALLRELGGEYGVTGTTHYLVAHPSGSREPWAERFEEFYRRFVHYFSVRGFSLAEPPFPLVAIVCRNRAEFARHARRDGPPASEELLGFYSVKSNRVVLYDAGEDGGGPGFREQNLATVIHEATHQMAFNTGVHRPTAEPPVWVAEGLATVLEGVVGGDAGASGPRQSRVNQGRLRDFRKHVGPGLATMLAEMVADDRGFRTSPRAAYAAAWALTFYLCETQPSRYWQYLARTAARSPLERYPAAQRMADFAASFGTDWKMLEARLRRFIDELSAR